MEKKPIFLDEELPIHSTIEESEKQWEELGKLAQETMQKDFNGEGEVAKDFKASGRRCPKCGNLLRVKEETDAGVAILNCFDCFSTFHHTDLVADETADKIYRLIPDSDFLRWQAFFERTKGKD